MILVDTSVLIDYFRGAERPHCHAFQWILDGSLPFGINAHIYQELLQGTRLDQEYEKLKTYLDSQVFYQFQNPLESHAQAAQIYRRCRKSGYSGVSTIDCLIAQTAIENDLWLLHHDSDFEKIAKVAPLKLFSDWLGGNAFSGGETDDRPE